MMQKYSSAMVLGLGASGYAAARLLLNEKTEVIVIDGGDDAGLRRRAEALVSLGAEVLIGQSRVPDASVQVCVVSPGVPLDSEWMREIHARNIPVIPELELGWSRAKCRVLAVTGSNGKSTLVKLCAESLSRAGLKTAVAGNHEDASTGLSLPASQILMESKPLDWLVLEASSFQLETTQEFRPDVGVLLNLLPNHLNRHGNMARYQQAKLRLFAKMTEHDIGIIPESMADEAGAPSFESGRARWISFGTSNSAVFRYADGSVSRGGNRLISLSGTMFENDVLGVAAAAATAAIYACGESCDHVESAARSFSPLPHRMRKLGVLQGVSFINDAKSSNAAAVAAALRIAGACGIHLIFGGRPKGDDYMSLLGVLPGKVVSAYLIGEAARDVYDAWRKSVDCFICETLDRAVSTAFDKAKRGETILLSPGCASMDQFSNYIERGNRFQHCFDILAEEKKKT